MVGRSVVVVVTAVVVVAVVVVVAAVVVVGGFTLTAVWLAAAPPSSTNPAVVVGFNVVGFNVATDPPSIGVVGSVESTIIAAADRSRRGKTLPTTAATPAVTHQRNRFALFIAATANLARHGDVTRRANLATRWAGR